MPSLKQLQHEYDRTRGLWCIDRNPVLYKNWNALAFEQDRWFRA